MQPLPRGDTGPMFRRKRLLVLDMDGTVIRSKAGKKFVQGPEDVEIIPGTEDVLQRYIKEDWLLCAATNQGGVAYGIRTQEEITAEFVALSKLWQQGEPFDGRIQVCPFHPKGKEPRFTFESLCRKPHYGMLVLLEAQLYANGIICDWPNSLMVGDMITDFECAQAAGIAFQWADEFFGRGSAPQQALDVLEDFARGAGFSTAAEMRQLLAQFDLVDPIHFRELTLWRDSDGTKAGLADVLARVRNDQ
jgi:D-glycero-D-manno-heptose 1,7-bisphosphate phosphatase